jgi:hypothetical protein
LHEDIPDGSDGGINGEDNWPVVSNVIKWTECWGAGDEILDILHGCYLLCSKMESNVFACQVNKGMGMLSEVFNEYPYEPTSAKKAMDISDVYRYRCHTLIKCVSRCAGSVLNQAVSGCSGKLNYINYINHLFKDITKC